MILIQLRHCNIILLICFFTLLHFNSAYTQAAFEPVGADIGGMARTSVAVKNVWAAFNNPANLSDIEKIAAAVNYENRFLVREMGISSITTILPTGYGVFGLAFNQIGSNLYSQSFVGLAYGRDFGERLRAGVRLNALHTRLSEDYGSRTDISFAAGFNVNLTKELTIAAMLANPLHKIMVKGSDEYLPAIYRLGLHYKIEKNLFITAEAEKDMRYKPSIRTGIEYKLKEFAAVRAGISTNPLNHAFGFGFNFGSFTFDISAVRHEVLGYSPQASLIWIAK